MNPRSDSITVLRSPHLRLAKRLRADGGTDGYDRAKTVDAFTVDVASLDDVLALLRRLLPQYSCCVVRGRLICGTTARGVRRLLYMDKETGELPTFEDVARRWLALDLDGLPLPAGILATDLSSCAAAARATLPEPFQRAACITQASASHNVKPGIRLRMWFWLSRPTWGHEVKRWLKEAPVDASVFGSVQPIYTAAPVLEAGVADPMPTRLLEVAGAGHVAVPAPELLSPPRSPDRAHAAAAIRDARAHRYVRAALERAAGAIANAREGNRHPLIVAESCRLARFVDAGLLSGSTLADVVKAAAKLAGKDDEGELNAAVAYGLANPWKAGPLQVGQNKDASPIYKNAADVWLRHRDRRQYIAGVAFDPTNSTAPGVLNLWQGYAVEPAPGDWSRLRRHIEQVICAGNMVHFHYLMGWMARLLQHPDEHGEVAVVMKGGEGTGKGTLAKALKRIIGQHALAIANAKHLVGNFNSHLRDCVLLFADEAFFAGDRAHVGVLKSIITEAYLTVEAKYANAVEVPNYLHLLMASNEEWVVPASLDARRFFVLEVLGTYANDHAYFAEIWQQMEAGGYSAMLYDLLAYDLSIFNVRAVPTTEGLSYQRKLSLGTTESWWLDCLERGYVFRSRLGLEEQFATWHDRVTMELLFASYTDFAKGRNERRPLSREDLGKFLTKHGAFATRWRNGIVGEHFADERSAYGDTIRKAKPVLQERSYGYEVGQLASARVSFLNVTGLNVTWGSDE